MQPSRPLTESGADFSLTLLPLTIGPFYFFFISDQIAGKQFQYSLCRPNQWCCIQTNVNGATEQALFPDFIPGKAHCYHRANDRYRLHSTLDNLPAAGSYSSPFQTRRHNRSQVSPSSVRSLRSLYGDKSNMRPSISNVGTLRLPLFTLITYSAAPGVVSILISSNSTFFWCR